MKNMIIFDGECNYCKGQIQKIQQRAKSDLFEYLPRKSENLLTSFPELKPFEEQDGLRFIDSNRNIFIGPDAVYQIYKRIAPFNLIAWTYCIPGLQLFFKLAYNQIAKNRYKIAGKCEDNICAVPYQQRKN